MQQVVRPGSAGHDAGLRDDRVARGELEPVSGPVGNDRQHLAAQADGRAPAPGGLGETGGHVQRIAVPHRRLVAADREIVGTQARLEVAQTVTVEQLDRDAALAHPPVGVAHARRRPVACDDDVPAPHEARGKTRALLHLREKGAAEAGQVDDRRVVVVLAEHGCRGSRRAARRPGTLDQQGSQAALGQVEGDRAARRPGADHADVMALAILHERRVSVRPCGVVCATCHIRSRSS